MHDLTPKELEAIALAFGESVDALESADAPPPPVGPPAKSKPWYPALNPTQDDIFNDPSDNVLGDGEKGCLGTKTIIATMNGAKRLGRFLPEHEKLNSGFHRIHEEVINTGVVTAVWVESDKKCLRIIFENGHELHGSVSHKMWVCWMDQSGEHGFGWKSFGEVQRLKSADWKFWIPTGSAGQQYDESQFSNNLSYAIGALVGDGALNCCGKDCRSVGFTNKDGECIESVKAGLAEIGCSLNSVKSKNNCQYTITPRGNIAPIIKRLGIACTSYHKIIPDEILESGKKCIASFLSGLFDTDGTVEKSGLVSFCTTSEQLGLDVQSVLMAVFGILCVRRSKKSASGRPTWTLSIMGRHAHRFGQEIGFRIKRKQERILKPKISTLCPDGFNSNRYGYPAPICGAMKRVATANRSGVKKHHAGKVHRDRAWHNRHRHLHSFKSVPCKRKVEQFCKLYGCATELSEFLKSDVWLEVETITAATDRQLLDLHVEPTSCYYAAGLLSHNSGKTVGFGHKIVRHAYENDGALAMLITPSLRTGNDGIWYDLDTLILPAWRDGNRDKEGNLLDEGIGLEYTKSKLDPLTKDRHRWIKNRFGTWSKLLLLSIQHAAQVADRIKGPAPSLVYVDELTNCNGREYWTYPAAQLGRRRGIHGPQQYLASCNPDGPSHWVYKVFFEDCVDAKGVRDKAFARYHVPISENEKWLPRGYVDRLKKIFRSDPIEYRRLIGGEWIDRPTGDGLFKLYFNTGTHMKGDAAKKEWLMPFPGFPILVGYDLGQVNSSVTFMQQVPTKDRVLWLVLDEIDHLGERILYKTLAWEVIERMKFWRNVKLPANGGKPYPFEYMHIADESAVNQWRPGAEGSYDAWDFEKEYNRVQSELGGREMRMLGCPKGAGSVSARVRLLSSKLYQQEVAVSARCENTKMMLLQLEADDANPENPRRSKWLHKFDSLTYPMFKLEMTGGKNLPTAVPTPSLLRIGDTLYSR